RYHGVRHLAVGPLSLRESLAFTRRLPHLRALRGSGKAGVDAMRRILEIAQGHPKLLEMADAAASDTTELAAVVNDAARALPGGARLQAFLGSGESEVATSDLSAVLRNWTLSATSRLDDMSKVAFAALSRGMPQSRTVDVFAGVWALVGTIVSGSYDGRTVQG